MYMYMALPFVCMIQVGVPDKTLGYMYSHVHVVSSRTGVISVHVHVGDWHFELNVATELNDATRGSLTCNGKFLRVQSLW